MSPAIPLRILHTESSLNWGGQEYRTLEEVRWLRAHGHMAWIACDPASELMRRAGLDLCIPVKMARSFDWRTSDKLRRFCREQKVNVIHTHSSKDSWLCYPLHVAAWPVVRSRQITNLVRPSIDRSFIYRHGCAAVVASAECIRGNLVAHTGVAEECVHVIGEGTDIERFNPAVDRRGVRAEWGVSPETVLFGLVAMIRPEKGHGVFVAAAVELLKTHGANVRFAMVGEGVGERAYEQEIRDLLVRTFGSASAGPVFMTGYRRDVPEVMAALDVLVVPSLAEAQSIVTPQAFATGRPVIASRVGGLPELVTHGQTGFLVTPGDAVALASAMARLADDEPFRNGMGARARLYALQALSFSVKMQECVALYRTVVAARAKTRVIGKRKDPSAGVRDDVGKSRRRPPLKRLVLMMAPVTMLALAVLFFLNPTAPFGPPVEMAAASVEPVQSSVDAQPNVMAYGDENEDESFLDEILSPSLIAVADAEEHVIG